MTLAMALVAGILVGYKWGLNKKAALVIGAFLVVIALAQACFYIAVNETANLSYWTAILLVVAFGAIWIGSRLRNRARAV